MTTPPEKPRLACPLCHGQKFSQETSKQDSRWGFTAHKMTLMICQQCSHVLHFYNHRTFFGDFD